MPQYSYRNPKTGKIKDVFQTMNEEHSYSEGGVQWERVWTVPQAAVDANIDPFSTNAFVEKTGKEKGNMGSLWDRSSEMSEKRAAKRDGVDPVKQKYYDDYASKRKGKRNPREIKEKMSKINVTI
jgi:hypothetical protein